MAIMLAFGWFHGEDDINNINFYPEGEVPGGDLPGGFSRPGAGGQ